MLSLFAVVPYDPVILGVSRLLDKKPQLPSVYSCTQGRLLLLICRGWGEQVNLCAAKTALVAQ